MKKSTKIILIILTVIAAAVCVACCLFIFQFLRGGQLNDRLQAMTEQSTATHQLIAAPSAAEDDTETAPTEDEAEAGPETVELPDWYIGVDFQALWEINEDIYAWINIPDTNINYPVLQSPTNDLFYNSHGVDRNYYSGGSIFSQRYNTTTFTDPVTVLYGHNYDFTAMFSQLNDFADPEFFAQHPYIYIYTPDKVYQYEIFASYPHSSEHLLLCHDFTDPEQFAAYFDSLADGLDTNYLRDIFPDTDDLVLTLSTCYKQNRLQRYLVQGVLVAEYAIEVQ